MAAPTRPYAARTGLLNQIYGNGPQYVSPIPPGIPTEATRPLTFTDMLKRQAGGQVRPPAPGPVYGPTNPGFPAPPDAPSRYRYGVSGYVPRSLTSSLNPKVQGGVNMGVNLVAGAGANAANNAIRSNSGIMGNPFGRILASTTGAVAPAAYAGPQVAGMAGVGGLGLGTGFEAQRFIEDPNTNPYAGAAGTAAMAGLSSAPVLGPLVQAGQMLARVAPDASSPIGAYADLAEKIPGVGGWLGEQIRGFTGEGGGEQAAAGPTAEEAQAQAELRAQAFTPENLATVMSQSGLPPEAIQQAVTRFEQNVTYRVSNPQGEPSMRLGADGETVEYLGADGNPVDSPDKARRLTPDEIIVEEWMGLYEQIPAAAERAQLQQQQTYQTAAMQAALAEMIPAYTQPFNSPVGPYGSVGELIANLPGSMQGSAQNMVDVNAQGNANLADAYAAQMASIPAYLTMQDQAKFNAGVQGQADSRLQYLQAQQMYPWLFPQKEEESGTGDPIADAALAANG